MLVRLWGTRGSLASPGPETVRYSGNTSCVEIRGPEGELLILDAGTGIRRLGAALAGNANEAHLLLTHLHMDHIQGLGFFAPLFRAEFDMHIWGPPSSNLLLRDRLSRYLSPPLFPVRLRELPSLVAIHDILDGEVRIGSLTMRAEFVCHPGPTVGYRITDGRSTVTYLPDHEPALGHRKPGFDPRWTSGFDLARDTDLLIHDCQYAAAEYEHHLGWGHGTVEQAVDFAEATGAARLVTYHHDPAHSDTELDAMLATVRARARTVQVLPG
jgi:phosphoribosyl 1,2-cyclic phosphodiesterase